MFVKRLQNNGCTACNAPILRNILSQKNKAKIAITPTNLLNYFPLSINRKVKKFNDKIKFSCAQNDTKEQEMQAKKRPIEVVKV